MSPHYCTIRHLWPDFIRWVCVVQLGMGTVVMHYFSGLVSSLLKELGLSDDMFNPVSMALLLCFCM